jgi:manganese oxidase
VVTQRIAQGETFDMSWSPTRPGNWLLHCHVLQHMVPATIPNVPGPSISLPVPERNEHADMQEAAGMGQLVLGITVPARTGSEALTS